MQYGNLVDAVHERTRQQPHAPAIQYQTSERPIDFVESLYDAPDDLMLPCKA